MSFQVVKDLRRFADEESETLGRDVLRRQLHKFAERVDETIENITAHYIRRIAKQAGVMAETAHRNVYLSSKLKNVEQMLEREIACRQRHQPAAKCAMKTHQPERTARTTENRTVATPRFTESFQQRRSASHSSRFSPRSARKEERGEKISVSPLH